MYKSVCAAVLLLAAVAFTSGGKIVRAAGSSLTAPVIVASVKMPSQAAPIPETTIFTPSQDGLYRVSAYATTTKVGRTAQWTYSLAWTDDAGPQVEMFVLQQQTNQRGPFVNDANTFGGAVRVFEAKAGAPIEFNLRQEYSDGSEISLYFVVEQLE
jgi:hypothetical protein